MRIQPTNPTNEIVTQPVTVDFSHRLTPTEYNPASVHSLRYAVDNAAQSAATVLSLLQEQFIGIDTVKISDPIMFFAIQSAMDSINDINKIVEAHTKAVLENQQA